jgi:hypothetical protein
MSILPRQARDKHRESTSKNFDVWDSLSLLGGDGQQQQQEEGWAQRTPLLPKALQVWRTDTARAFYHDGTVPVSTTGALE